MRDLLVQKEQAERNVSFYSKELWQQMLRLEVLPHHLEPFFVAEIG